MFPLPKDPEVVFACACADRAARFVMEDRVFVGQFEGSIATTLAQPKTDAHGMQTVPLNIVGYSTQSDVEGLGRVSLDFDFSRPVPASTVRGDPKAGFFPAIQTMHLQILMTADVFPGMTLRSRQRGTLVNDFAESFPPPKGATYTLQRPVELVDPANPEKTLIRLVTVNTQILSTRMAPEELRVGSGVLLHLGNARKRAAGEAAVTLPRGGTLVVRLFGANGRRVRDGEPQRVKPGTHSFRVDTAGLRGARYSYQLFLDDTAVTARMPLSVRG